MKYLKSRFPIFLLSFFLPLLSSWQMLHTDPISGRTEPTLIASSIVHGHGFRSPYDERQPTAWIAPVYPYVVALVFRVFGIYSRLSIYSLVLLNALFSGLTALAIYAIGRRVFGVSVGVAAGWLWALCLPNRVMPLLLFETCLSAALLAVGFFLTLRLYGSTEYRRWAAVGLFWGLACLVNPALVAPVFFLWLYFCLYGRKPGRNLWRQVAVSAALFIAVLAPWLIRNYRVFGRPVFVRSNLAAEIYFGNFSFESHPLHATGEYQRLGEIAFVAEKKTALKQYIRDHPGDFLRRSLHRAVLFWIVPGINQNYWLVMSLLSFVGLGLALHDLRSKALPFLIVFCTYPLVYYASYVFPKYRHPVEPFIFLCAAYALIRAGSLAGDAVSHFNSQREISASAQESAKLVHQICL
jgi:Dolichyl-phosphate-mannose-protein mannosyltransferase